MKTSRPRRWRLLRWLIFVLLVLAFVLYIGLPVGLGVYVVFPYQQGVGATPPGFETVSLSTDDGVTLAAWYHPSANGAAVILIHGAGGSREDVRAYARLLADQQYGVLALDLRGHGASDGKTNRLGWQGTRDVGAAVAFLQAQDGVQAIGGLGLSLGGEVLLGAASTYPLVRAIAADGATHRSMDELLALPSERPLYRNFTARVFHATVRLLSGTHPPQPPLLQSMRESGATRFLLIAGGSDRQEVAYNELFAHELGARATLWVAPDAPHTGAFERYPDEYAERLLAFFAGALVEQPAPET